MTNLLTWVLCSYGLTLIVTGSKIFAPFRSGFLNGSFWYTLVHCPMCFGFWSGVLLSLLHRWNAGFPALGAGALFDGCASSAACWMIHVVLHRLGASEL